MIPADRLPGWTERITLEEVYALLTGPTIEVLTDTMRAAGRTYGHFIPLPSGKTLMDEVRGLWWSAVTEGFCPAGHTPTLKDDWFCCVPCQWRFRMRR